MSDDNLDRFWVVTIGFLMVQQAASMIAVLLLVWAFVATIALVVP